MNITSRYLLIGVFFLSGLSGLIYESIWSHYLKLFLGHAAYAQTLVLILFMGGLAIGSWLTARLTEQRRINLLLAYAVIEAVIGIFAITFHSVFINVVELSFNTIIPSLGSPFIVTVYKWGVAALLIAPQCILLGATFPLMSAGFIRRSGNAGHSIATLYFINSLGACAGVLVSAFILIGKVGLPGTILSGGIINILLACLVWLLVKSTATEQDYQVNLVTHTSQKVKIEGIFLVFIATAALTGCASFIYEIVWIRMLSLVLGSSTHAFELMLSAFILGLALGGYYIRSRIHHFKNPVRALAYIQWGMGLLAASTALFYNQLFQLMSFFFHALQHNDQGYILFNFFSHLLAIMVMLPATFLAGMTLPLLTHILIEKGYGERSIGHIYASNTLGSIVGVIIAVHILLPYLGLKNALMTGALLDVLLAIILFRRSGNTTSSNHYFAITGIGTIAAIAMFSVFNISYMSSGVFRHGLLDESLFNKSLYHRDGKTASIDVVESISDNQILRSIRTNGKPDAGIIMGDVASYDEPTMMLVAWLPLSLHPSAKNIANIGMGSGLTTHTLLGSEHVESVDTIEIEPAMVEGAKLFGKHVERAFTDPRSTIYIEDAKTFFTTHNKKYDVIVSEPSNPWVSGVATLFTDEFYTHIKRHLNDDGIMVQWMQIYEINDHIVGSILKAMSNNFSDYQIYNIDRSDIVFVAKVNGKLPPLSGHLFENSSIREDMKRVHLASLADIDTRLVADKSFIEPLFPHLNLPPNSDYFPVVDQNAARARFKNEVSLSLVTKKRLYNLLSGRSLNSLHTLQPETHGKIYNPSAIDYLHAMDIARSLDTGGRQFYLDASEVLITNQFKSIYNACKSSAEWPQTAWWVFSMTAGYLPESDSLHIWNKISSMPCFHKSLDAEHKLWVNFFKSFILKDDAAVIHAFNEMRNTNSTSINRLTRHDFFHQAIIISYIRLGQYYEAEMYWKDLPEETRYDPDLLFLVTTAQLRASGNIALQ